MELYFERVYSDDNKGILEIYEIIKACGEHMYQEYGLVHWKTPYPIESIKKDSEQKEVYLVKDTNTGKYVHTFQLEFRNRWFENSKKHDDEKKLKIAFINKFATHPKVSGKGVGKLSMQYIENYCRKNGVSKLCLDVYDKSKHAIQFYINRGFIIVGSKPTKHFNVLLMEKDL